MRKSFSVQNKGVAEYTVLHIRKPNYFVHIQKVVEILVCTKGHLYVSIGERFFRMNEGGIAVIAPYTQHSLYTPKDLDSEICTVTIQSQDYESCLKNAGMKKMSFYFENRIYKEEILHIAKNLRKEEFLNLGKPYILGMLSISPYLNHRVNMLNHCV
ncbi:MAG: AraC family ligand binding domain-containing protein, partial [Erysipelotrichaceae bacterium]|nr:AraC family ligand binding domain-containing protein [Erysipelotrichaceae bacterium]